MYCAKKLTANLLILTVALTLLQGGLVSADDNEIRKELEAIYEKMRKAIRDKDAHYLKSLMTDDYTERAKDGTIRNRQQAIARVEQAYSAIKEVHTYTIRIDSIKEVKDSKEIIVEAGDFGEFSLSGPHGKLHRLSGGGRQRDTWILTGQGLKIKRHEELESTAQLDGESEEANRLAKEARKLNEEARYDEAIQTAERALAIRERVLGPEHFLVGVLLNDLAKSWMHKSSYEKAEQLLQRSLSIFEKSLDPDNPNIVTSLNSLAIVYMYKGDFSRAEIVLMRAINTLEKRHGPNVPGLAEPLDYLAAIYSFKGDFAKAEPLLIRAIDITEKRLGPDHPNIAKLIDRLAWVYNFKADFSKSKPLLIRAIGIVENKLGADHPDAVKLLDSLATVYKFEGDLVKAESLYIRAINILEKKFGPDHPRLSSALQSLALLYDPKGDLAMAERLLQRALEINKKYFGPDNPYAGQLISNLANIYYKKRDLINAESHYLRALGILERGLGVGRFGTELILMGLGRVYSAKGDKGKAESFFLRALESFEKLGPDSIAIIGPLNELGLFYIVEGDYAKAESLLQRSLLVVEKTLGPNHRWAMNPLYLLTLLYDAKGETAKAIDSLRRANEISDRSIAIDIAAGSERQKLLYLAPYWYQTSVTCSIHIHSAPDSLTARRLALLTILRRKGRTIDAIQDSVGALRRRLDKQDQALLDQLTETRSRLATLTLRGPGNMTPASYKTEINNLETKHDMLENAIGLRSAEFRAESPMITIEAVQESVPNDAAIVEFMAYKPLTMKTRAARSQRYVAYILTAQGEPASADLGEAEPIHNAVKSFRDALRNPERGDVKPLGRALDALVFQPLRKLLGEKRHVLISPDGALNLIPFAALVDERDRYLAERYLFTYLTSGRDLLRLQARTQSRQGPVLVANPDFGLKPRPGQTVDRGDSKTIDFSQVYFSPLPGTAEEAERLKTMFPEAVLLTGEQATESAVKRIAGPSVLHIATHGFFLEEATAGPPVDIGEELMKTEIMRELVYGGEPGVTRPDALIRNPFFRSGLGLAGANLRKSEGDDGILTAMEVAGLDMWGTKLAVLSACDTGVGHVTNGESVFGLRRAILLAGCETQVMSLWPVSDTATRDLMTDYYKSLKAGQGRGEALRQVQLKFMSSKDRNHPFYWASFIQSGEWANMDGKR